MSDKPIMGVVVPATGGGPPSGAVPVVMDRNLVTMTRRTYDVLKEQTEWLRAWQEWARRRMSALDDVYLFEGKDWAWDVVNPEPEQPHIDAVMHFVKTGDAP